MITFNNYNQKKRTKNINNLVYQKFIIKKSRIYIDEIPDFKTHLEIKLIGAVSQEVLETISQLV